VVNSGFLQDRVQINAQRKKEQLERESNLAAPVIAQGSAAEAFKNAPFWKVIDRDLGEIEDSLLRELTDAKVNLTKYKMDELRRRITDIRLFRDLPNKYIVKLQEKRRGRKVA